MILVYRWILTAHCMQKVSLLALPAKYAEEV